MREIFDVTSNIPRIILWDCENAAASVALAKAGYKSFVQDQLQQHRRVKIVSQDKKDPAVRSWVSNRRGSSCSVLSIRAD